MSERRYIAITAGASVVRDTADEAFNGLIDLLTDLLDGVETVQIDVCEAVASYDEGEAVYSAGRRLFRINTRVGHEEVGDE